MRSLASSKLFLLQADNRGVAPVLGPVVNEALMFVPFSMRSLASSKLSLRQADNRGVAPA